MTHRLLASLITLSLFTAGAAGARESDELSGDALSRAHPHTKGGIAPRSKGPLTSAAKNASTGIDSVVTFDGSFRAPGVDPTGLPQDVWLYTMLGRAPNRGETTTFGAPIVPVNVELLAADGTVRMVNGQPLYSDVTQFIPAVLESPVYQNSRYTSSARPTQISDAIHRAQFWKFQESENDRDRLDSDWHTLLAPSVKAARVIKVPFGSYRFALNADGTCCKFILIDDVAFGNLLFPATSPVDATTPVGAAELAGEVTTHDISSFIFPNTFLYQGGDPANCCILGYHTFDSEPGDASNGNRARRFVLNYSSWISPGLFGAGFSDITALSHEVSETYSDPFVVADGVHNLTPFWLSPNGNCQNDLEDGDVVEGLPNATFPVTINDYVYHPQNEALLSWFAQQTPSLAIHGAYSYPDETVLTGPATPQRLGCQ